ncbi:probable LRR receptor-like serine/threonine-protein kinase At1g05700 isoform X2 [Elaeis guineensis]|uniref:non-specific serine/threonine protein kinase n=1 Tax=Elaeis guineensis var. tenera TaxID=51953 RepID=A0A6J0PER6_ELAGV|nr:probable LRR receptor-like serine/threonine-protein kinase At1g05700 [Elaeis guineensis]
MSLPNMVIWFFLLLGVSVVTVRVLGQPSTDGFISIDCGIPDGYTYTDDNTSIPYVSDGQFIDTGTSYNISASYLDDTLPRQRTTLRSFPTGARNCYTLRPVMQDGKYLIRATFTYGNYDGLHRARPDNPILFDLYIGVNLWKSINISNASFTYSTEVMTIASAEFISVCLINNGSGTPFISSLELRPLENTMYRAVNDSYSLVLYSRLNLGTTTDKTVRFPDDGYDRVWRPCRNEPDWSEVSTTSRVRNYPKDVFEAPSAVMQTAVIPANSSSLNFYWDIEDGDPASEYYVILHISELQNLTGNKMRQFDVYGIERMSPPNPHSPLYLVSDSIFGNTLETGYSRYNVSLDATTDSTLPPILNAREIYAIRPLSNVTTDIRDVDAIMAIKVQYQVKKNWMGDPCSPKDYAWDGVSCDASMIVAINLSSSGLTGVIGSSFARLKAIEYLDLSYNNLTGPIPDFLADLSSLQVLNLTGNHFNGTIPDALRSKKDKGLLVLSIDPCIDENPCPSKKNKKKITAPIIVILSVVGVVLLLVLMFIAWRLRQRVPGMTPGASARLGSEDCSGQKMDFESYPLQFESRQFTYMQLVNMTDDFVRVIGKGGFGMVYHGCSENGTEVAVKMLSESSSQGAKEFLAEAQNLTRIHHRNLVSLVGYCKDGNYLALVYEYMRRGNLRENLNGVSELGGTLSWRKRLQIALDAAQGLEYLHKGCKPPIIHRDVKTSNILLGEDLEAKIADFGLARAFHSDAHTHVSTLRVVGTPGYIDPEFHNSFQQNEKSDVYGYGVVLLELITGQPPLLPPGPETVHIAQRVASKLARGNIDDIVDARLQGEYDANSVWKVVELAMKCTAQASTQRPTMSDVVMQLKESLALVNEGIDVSQDGAFEIPGKGSVTAGPTAR